MLSDKQREEVMERGKKLMKAWSEDWNKFIADAFGVKLDKEQKKIVSSVQINPRTSVASGTARGKDFVAACSAMAFMNLTPTWNTKGELIGNTKVALTAPTDRQVKNIMMPEIARLHNRAKQRGIVLPGRLNAYDIRTEYEEWFLTGFKADEHNHEAWSGLHAVNVLFVVTEATGISDDTFEAIEGNLQGNSRLLLVFNPNTTVGYAAKSQKGERFVKFRLNSLDAPNVTEKKMLIPGQVDYQWVIDKIQNWCSPIRADEAREEEDDFQFEGRWYRPTDVFRKKVLGKFPKVSEDTLIPEQWIEAAEQRWMEYNAKADVMKEAPLYLGSDVAGMGRDNSGNCYRFDKYVSRWDMSNSAGVANHMETAGKIKVAIDTHNDVYVAIDTIGEGAGVFSRLVELGYDQQVFSCKYSAGSVDHAGKELKDVTGQYTFANMRAYLHWAVRDWLDPKNNTGSMLPPSSSFKEEATEIKWRFRSDGKIIIEPKEDIKKRLTRSTDMFDALANTFFPFKKRVVKNMAAYFR